MIQTLFLLASRLHTFSSDEISCPAAGFSGTQGAESQNATPAQRTLRNPASKGVGYGIDFKKKCFYGMNIRLFLSHLSILKTERSLSQRQSRSCFQRKIFECTQKTKLFRFAQYLPAGRQVFNNWINATELSKEYSFL